MNSPQETRGYLELVDSMSTVEFDADRELFQAEYDRNQDPVSMAVVALVATVRDKEPDQLAPLYSSLDADAIEELFPESTTTHRVRSRISFIYEGFQITILDNGRIEAVPQENA